MNQPPSRPPQSIASQAHSSVLLLLFSLLIAAAGGAQGPDITLEEVTTNLDPSTIGIARPGDGSGRLFTVAKDGYIQIWDGSQVLMTPFLDLNTLVGAGGEQGLLGLAFHPSFETNRFFYVYYTDNAGDSVIARYQASDVDANLALPGTATPVLSFSQPAPNHNGGDLHFGADGYLYISSGDGGGDWCVSQNTTSLLGKILRIDVDTDAFPTDPEKNYGIPAGNPFAMTAGAAGEIWVMGLRNPWRFSFDRANGDLFIGDVGEKDWEEFSHLPADSQAGINLGWPWFEGDATFTTCSEPVGTFTTCDQAPFTCPVMQLSRSVGACSSIGGYRYRGSAYPSLRGIYFFTDWCEGELHSGIESSGTWEVFDSGNLSGFGPTGFGEDDLGELYVVNGSAMYQITGTYHGLFSDGFESGNVNGWSP